MNLRIIVFALICSCALSACVKGLILQPLEAQAVPGLEVESGHSGPVFGITVSGLCAHSALSVKTIEIKREGHVLQVLVWLTPIGGKGLSGSFSKWVPIPDDITSVVFGKKKAVIWPRQSQNGKEKGGKSKEAGLAH